MFAKALFLVALVVCGAMAAPKVPSILEIAEATPDLSTLVTAVKAAGLVGVLSGPGPFTVFAPTNEAFNALPAGVLDDLLKPENKAALVAVLTYHVAAARALSSDLHDGQSVTTVNGNNVTVGINSNGVFINLAQVTTPNVLASNGVVHVVNAVILPPSNQSIVQTAEAAGNLNTLVKAVVAAGLAGTLSGPGPFTVLAPTDAAFAKLPAAEIAYLLDPAHKGDLVKVLTYHVIAGNVFSTDLINGEEAKTLEGQTVSVQVSADGVAFNGNAKVVAANIFTSNGVVHEIDTVLIPPKSQSKFQLFLSEERKAFLNAAGKYIQSKLNLH